jgi:hypothetical protein
MTITLKDMKLIFNINAAEDTWERRVEDLDGNLIWTSGTEILLEDQRAFLDDWETQMRSLPVWNIVEHERNFL